MATLRPTDFWIGARVLRKHNQAWFLGTIIDVHEDGGHTLYLVDYDDCGREDIDRGELYDSVIYHPRLERSLYRDTQLPALNQMIMFALQRSPRFGKIVEINPLLSKPLSVMLWKPHSKAKSMLTARFKSTQHLEAGAEIVRITPAQIKTHVEFTPEGQLDRKSQDRVRRLMTRSQRQPHAKIPRQKPKDASSDSMSATSTTKAVTRPTKPIRPSTRTQTARNRVKASSSPRHRYPTRLRQRKDAR